MDDLPPWAPRELDLGLPSAARIYDYFLGGSHNFQADRDMGERILAVVPDFPATTQANRAFLRRAVRELVGLGLRQFLDLGSGIPTVGNVHEVARQMAADARVVYVDLDPVAVQHSRLLLEGDQHATAVQHDIRRPEEILTDPEVTALLDFAEPVAVLMASVLHFVPETDNPKAIIARFREELQPGSHLLVSHGTAQNRPGEGARLMKLFEQTSNPLTSRTRDEILTLFEGFDLLDPGLVWAPQWRPEPGDRPNEHPERSSVLVGVGRLGTDSATS